MLTSAIPIGLFLFVGGATFVSLLAISSFIGALIEGGVLAVSGTVLIAVLVGCVGFSLFSFTAATVVWGGLKTANLSLNLLSGVDQSKNNVLTRENNPSPQSSAIRMEELEQPIQKAQQVTKSVTSPHATNE